MKQFKPMRRPRPSNYRQYEAVCRTESVETVVTQSDPSDENQLYTDFVAWMNYKKVTSEQFRYITHRYYNEFIGGL
jgi:hypothetical protein